MRRIAVLLALLIFLFLGLVISNLVTGERVDLSGVTVKQDVFVMFGFGLAALVGLTIYDIFSAFGAFRSQREQQKQIEKLESELLKPKDKSV